MNILVLGGTGFVGRVLSAKLAEIEGSRVIVAARNLGTASSFENIRVEATNVESVASASKGIDVIVNCVTGSGTDIRSNADAVRSVAENSNGRIRVMHMSSMAVYGSQQGALDETTAVADDGNWYGQAKIEAETMLGDLAKAGGSVTIFRIGCVYGARSQMWVDRVGLLLRNGRLGDLGVLGDGWSNLVHVNDIAETVKLALLSEARGLQVYNLSAPDSPRWNDYFTDFALAAEFTPVRYKTALSMAVETRLIAPPLKILERLAAKGLLKTPKAQCIPPSLLRLWSQHIKLDGSKVTANLGLKWTPYKTGLKDSIDYFLETYGR